MASTRQGEIPTSTIFRMVKNVHFSYQLWGLSYFVLHNIVLLSYTYKRLHLQCYFNTYLSQETTDGYMLFLVQPKDFACTTGLMGSYTLLLPPLTLMHSCAGDKRIHRCK